MTDALRKGFPPVLDGKRPSMTDVLRNSFPLFLNEKSLRLAVESVCAEFGKMSYLAVIPAMRGKTLHCACSVRLNSAESAAAMKSSLDLMEYAGELHFMADVDERWTGRTL